jgi:hypothetical protein
VKTLGLIVLLGLTPQQQTESHGPEPGPRAALAGLSGFQTVSRIDFGNGQRNRLTAVYVFPDRARWHFENYDARVRSEHQFYYRQGERVRELVTGKPSRELAAEEQDRVLVQMELRRAVLFWPEGFVWQELEGGQRLAIVEADSCCHERALGSLVATLENGLPVRVAAQTPGGEPIEALEVRAWQERSGRRWPATLVLAASGGGFTETIESVETDNHYLELFFLPPDVRAVRKTKLPGGPTVLARDIVAMTYAVRELPDPCSWEEALTRARAWIAEAELEMKPLELAVDPVPTFELSPSGRPARCLVRLATPQSSPPKGYLSVPERAGFFLTLPDLKSVDEGVLRRLGDSAPEGVFLETPYLRVHARTTASVEVVLPILPG